MRRSNLFLHRINKLNRINTSSALFIMLFIQELKPSLRACLHGGGGPQVGEVTGFGGVTPLSI